MFEKDRYLHFISIFILYKKAKLDYPIAIHKTYP